MSAGRKRPFLILGIGVGLLLFSPVGKRVISVIKSSPKFSRTLDNARELIVSAVEAGIEAARRKEAELSKDSDDLTKFESDEESPNYIV